MVGDSVAILGGANLVGVMTLVICAVFYPLTAAFAPQMLVNWNPTIIRVVGVYIILAASIFTAIAMNNAFAACLHPLEVGGPNAPLFNYPFVGPFGTIREAIPLVFVVTLFVITSTFLICNYRVREIRLRRGLD